MKTAVYGIFFISLLVNPQSAWTQLYTEGGKTRHRFAQMHLGLDFKSFPVQGKNHIQLPNGQWSESDFSGPSEVKILMGGTHFWGHADFYIGFPIVRFGNNPFTTGIETAARIYPWAIRKNKIRPFAGFGHLPIRFQQEDGARAVRQRLSFNAGISYQTGNHLLDLNAGYMTRPKLDYFYSTNFNATTQLPPFWAGISYRYLFDTTISAEENWQSGRTKIITDTLAARKRLNGWTISIGPSVAFYLNRSERMKNDFAFLDRPGTSSVLADIGVGYYWHKPDLQMNLAYRKTKGGQSAFDYSQSLKRRSLAIESYIFFADYHGFAPFAGLAAGYEWLNVLEENNGTEVASGQFRGIKPGLVFGWDIRPNRIQSFYLRTNLRWFPNLRVNMPDGGKVNLDQLEVNFIQLVVFPGRLF